MNDLEWIRANGQKLGLLVMPILIVFAPCVEELVFRAPLLILFPVLNQSAWYGIMVSSILFGLMHWSGNLEQNSIIVHGGKTETNDLAKEREKLEIENKAQIVFAKCFRVVATTLAGVWFGYLAISHQSLWWSMGAHALWNFIMPTLLPIVLLVLWLMIQFIIFAPALWIYSKFKEIRFRRRAGLWKFP